MLEIIKVTGESLSPEYKEGDYVIIVTYPFFLRLKPGDTIVFDQPEYGRVIKKIQRIEYNLIYVSGAHANSVDSRRFGPVPRKNILGKVIWHIQKP